MTERRTFDFEDAAMRAHSNIQTVQTRIHQALVLGYMSEDGKRACAALLADAANSITKFPKAEDEA